MGTWVKVTDRQPTKYGRYRVIRRGYGKRLREDRYLWNGGYWVTNGHCISKAVEEWYDTGEEEAEGEPHES